MKKENLETKAAASKPKQRKQKPFNLFQTNFLYLFLEDSEKNKKNEKTVGDWIGGNS